MTADVNEKLPKGVLATAESNPDESGVSESDIQALQMSIRLDRSGYEEHKAFLRERKALDMAGELPIPNCCGRPMVKGEEPKRLGYYSIAWECSTCGKSSNEEWVDEVG